jgi:hypothetical protein
MSDEEKLSAVKNYLQSEFPGSKIEFRYEAGEKSHVVQILLEARSHHAILMDAFLSICEAAQIPAILAEFTLAEHLRDMGSIAIVVTPEGLKLEGD